jgi:hypothetical protein
MRDTTIPSNPYPRKEKKREREKKVENTLSLSLSLSLTHTHTTKHNRWQIPTELSKNKREREKLQNH